MAFTLTISTENAAFEACGLDVFLCREREVARILRDVADKLETGSDFSMFRTLFDINGNDVGRAAFKNWNAKTKSWDTIIEPDSEPPQRQSRPQQSWRDTK